MTFEQVSEEAAEILSRLDKEKISPEDQLVVLSVAKATIENVASAQVVFASAPRGK
jgi:hypothetical protein